MAIVKKGTRLIKVDDVDYRWVVKADDNGLGIVVECAENPGQILMAGVEHGNIISPWLVRKAILHALDLGWKPKQKDKIFGFQFEGMLQNPKDWTGVPAEYQEEWHQIYNESQESLNLSAPCPVCQMLSLHHWYQIGTPIDRVVAGRKLIATGALWEWCSNCHSFAHYSCFVPDWWSCDLEVDVDKLTALPIAIEKARLASLTSIEGQS